MRTLSKAASCCSPSAKAYTGIPLQQLFNDWFGGGPLRTGSNVVERTGFVPRMDITETESDYRVTIEVPGMDEKDIDVSLKDGTLVIRGEKKAEIRDEKEGVHRVERTYGSFRREVPLPDHIDWKHVAAGYENGVLSVTLPKSAEHTDNTRKIQIQGGK